MNRFVHAMLLVAAVAPAGRAEELTEKGLPQAVAEIAEVAVTLAKEEGGVKVVVGGFNPIGLGEVNTEGAIQAALVLALGADHDPAGTLSVTGDYKRTPTGVQITAKVSRTDGKELTKAKVEYVEKKASVTKVSDQMRLIPGSKVVPPLTPANPKDDKPTPQERVEAAAKPSTAFVKDGTLVQAKEGSLYAVELRTKKDLRGEATPLVGAVKGGEASVGEIPVGTLYEIRLLNFGTQEVSADVSVDGLSEFHFTADRKDGKKDGPPAYTGTLVPGAANGKPGEAVILGWYDRFDRDKKVHHYQTFQVVKPGEGAVSKVPNASRGKVGVVAVAFALSHQKGTSRGGGETGFGPPDQQKGDVVERVTDPPHEFVAVRYARPK